MESETRVQIKEMAIGISHCTNNLGETYEFNDGQIIEMNEIINLGKATDLGEGKL